MRHILLVLSVVFLILTSGKKSDKDISELKIGVMSSMDFVPLAVAQEKGFFNKQGVKVNIQKFYSANDRDAAFQSGNIDGTVIDYTGAIIQKAGGVDLKITSACNATFCVMTGTGSGIEKMEELKGKKIAVSRNTVIDFCIEMSLQSVQIKPDEIEKQEVNKIPIRLEMMMKGQTDATALPDPFITIAASKGAKILTSMEDLGYAVTGFIFKSEAIDKKSKELKAFYLAYNDAVEYIHSHSKEDIKSILINDIGFPDALIDSIKLPRYTLAQMPQDKDIEATIQWLQQKELIPAGFNVAGLLDNRFVKQ